VKVTLTDVNEDTGGLVVIPGSHKEHDRVCQRFGLRLAPLVTINPEDPILAQGSRLVCAEAGDLLLWDSRTVHCNTPALSALNGGEEEESADGAVDTPPLRALIRQVGYVCMTPAAWATEEVLEQRRDAFIKNISTSHWPHIFVRGGGALPGTSDRDPALASPGQRAMIGFDRPEKGLVKGSCCVS